MKRLYSTLLACAVSVVAGSEVSHGMGFHGGGGGFGGGYHGGGGFGGGGFGGGGYGGGMRSPSVGGFGGGGDFGDHNFGGGNFGGGNFGGGGYSGGRGFGGDGFGGGNFGGGADHGGIPAFGGGGGNFHPDGGFGDHSFSGNNAFGNGGVGNHVSDNQLQNFLGMSNKSASGNFDRNSNNNININENHIGNTNIGNQVGNKVGNQVGDQNRLGAGGAGERNQWLADHPDQARNISNWGNQVRDNWNDHGHNWWNNGNGVRPGSDWWSTYHPNVNSWYYHNGWGNHPWNYWWRGATWGAVGGWFLGASFADPMYYNYGTGGNVVYQDENVYVNGQDMGTPAAYYQSASDLAAVPSEDIPQTPASPDSAPTASDDWLPLGTFSLSTSKDDTNPVRTIQLAVNKQGIVSGTMYNSSTNQSWPVQGRVDKKTQRVAFTIGQQAGVVLETGIYNLTQPETEVLVHYGSKQTQTDLLVRLDAPADGSNSSGNNANGPLPTVQPNQ